MNTQEIETAARHFVISAIWADGPEGRKIRSARETDAIARAFVEAFAAAWPAECAQVTAADGYGSHPDAGSPAAAFGHDLYLTCAGHGTGFWDRRELGEVGELISSRIRAEWRRWYIESYCDRRRLYFCVSPQLHALTKQNEN
ncbi:hypothetical protein P3T23_009116 [Paraburkholderia sp. GAS448]|uniref:hypothetical protein n=1 Tax=Paraburkholderia sp. GAS448 TaxID=3035136 RepID=UPI003D204706